MSGSTSFPASMPYLHLILEWLRTYIKKSPLSKTDAQALEISLEEILVNIITHAYGNSPGKIELEFHETPEKISFSIRDFGPPFDPTQQGPDVDITSDINQREIGGLGIYFVKQLVDQVIYKREHDSNLLILIKHLPH